MEGTEDIRTLKQKGCRRREKDLIKERTAPKVTSKKQKYRSKLYKASKMKYIYTPQIDSGESTVKKK